MRFLSANATAASNSSIFCVTCTINTPLRIKSASVCHFLLLDECEPNMQLQRWPVLGKPQLNCRLHKKVGRKNQNQSGLVFIREEIFIGWGCKIPVKHLSLRLVVSLKLMFPNWDVDQVNVWCDYSVWLCFIGEDLGRESRPSRGIMVLHLSRIICFKLLKGMVCPAALTRKFLKINPRDSRNSRI